MKAYMIESNKEIEPFGDHPGDCLIANRKLSEIQKEVLQSLGIGLETTPDLVEVKDPNEHIIFDDSLLFTRELLQKFISKSPELKGCTICALKPGLVTLYSMVTTQEVQVYNDRVEYGLRYMPSQRLRGEPVPVVIDPEQFSQLVPVPEHIRGPQEYRIPMSDTFLIQVDHWTNLWAANMAHLLADVARLMKARKLKLLGLALKARSLNKWRVFHQVNKIGKNCDIHPTAYIEGSTIGDNVMIGAGSIIRLSVIGDGTAIGSNVTIECSILGEECSIDSGCSAFGSVLYPRTISSNRLIFTSLCGRDTFIADGSGLTDFRIDGKNVTVMKDDMPIDTGVLALGACLGHDVYLAPACIVAPGTAIPNGLRILPEKTLIISEVNPDGTIPGHRLITDLITGHKFSRSLKRSRTTDDDS
jgi:acetyltransferase-like isoleucine patch superfamily enzyme